MRSPLWAHRVAHRVAKHWRAAVAAVAGTIAVARVIIWIAKALGTLGTLEALASALGYADAVADFESAVDQVLETLLAATQRLVDRL